MVLKKKSEMLKGKCPFCGLVFEFPKEDRIDVILFDIWRKYHCCEKAKHYDEERKRS